MEKNVEPQILLRAADRDDLPAVNGVVERAVMTWDLPDRVKRLSMETYRYDPQDLSNLELVLAEAGGRIVGVAAWAVADPTEAAPGSRGLLLHGIYVDPAVYGKGIGSRLLAAAEAAARAQNLGGVLVKAQRGAGGFFLARGYCRLAVDDPVRDYPYRLWKDLSADP